MPLLGLLALAALLLVAGESLAAASTYTVDSTGDAGDFSTADGVCDIDDSVGDGPCTLRAAIEQANANAGADTIEFSIGTGVQTISPGSALPAITDPVIIDGTTQPGFTTTPIIELDGTSAGAVDGLNITAGSSTVKGLVINRFGGDGIELSTSGGNNVEGNYIGTDVSGTADLGNSVAGVYIQDAPSNTIGGTAAGAGNLISANDTYGIRIYISGATGNLVQGNYIGTDVTGTAALGNSGYGVDIDGAPGNTIGGTAAGARNVISGNGAGVRILGSGATGNVVEGNYIGTDVTGAADLGNASGGVYIAGVPGNTIGGTAAGAGNVISGNNQHGVYIEGSGATGNKVEGNYIGTDVTGTADLGNSNGVYILSAPSNTIGGTAAGARNVISGNGDGVRIDGSGATGNVVEGNYIGTDVTGTAGLGNSWGGVQMTSAPGNTIGGTAAGAGNVISGNNWYGVRIQGDSAAGNNVEGNYIGTDVTGTADLGNAYDGVDINSAPGTTIGGTTAGARNVISGNNQYGVRILWSDASGNKVEGNYIGTDVTGTVDLGNTQGGVYISNGASSNTIGGTAAGARNVISGNNHVGAYIYGSGATGNKVEGNYIGTDATGTADLGNSADGVYISGAPSNTIGGTAAGAGNVISGNDQVGVKISGGGATGNTVQGNYIGTDVTGTADLGNTQNGVYINGAPSNTIGGTAAGARNVISGNNSNGVSISASGATGNVVEGNYIGTDVTGTADLGNTQNGVYINGAPGNTIGGTAVGAANVIAHNTGDGVRVDGATAIDNPIRGNSIHSNGAKGIENVNGGNAELVPPTIISTGSVNGYACAFCTVDVYSDAAEEGRHYEGTAVAAFDGFFSAAVTPVGPNVTATATDAGGNTSEFSDYHGVDDFDNDTVPDAFDACPTAAEDLDGFQDSDGCPDPDNDMDGICDPGQTSVSCTGSDFGKSAFFPPGHDHGDPASVDCRNMPEDPDGFKDSDGCPEPDNDNDGFPDVTDACPGTDIHAGADGALGAPEDFNHNGIQDGGEAAFTSDDSVLTFEDYDGVIDTDGCHDSPGDDFDADGWIDDVEVLFLGTDPQNGCTPGGWPPDVLPAPDGDGIVGIDDVFFAAGRFNQADGDPNYTPRAEIASQDGVIGIDDVFGFAGRFNQSC